MNLVEFTRADPVYVKRRTFLQALTATAAGVLIPYEPKTFYSFPTPRIIEPTFGGLLDHALRRAWERNLDELTAHRVLLGGLPTNGEFLAELARGIAFNGLTEP